MYQFSSIGQLQSNLTILFFLPPGESKVFRPRRPRSSSDALSASFNGELLDSRQHCNSYDNLDGGEDSDDGPICVPALISPPRSAGEDVDLSPPDMGVASLDFDPMSFQCSLADSNHSYTFPLDELPAGAEGPKKSPMSLGGRSGANLISASFIEDTAAESRRAANPKTCSSDQPTQATRKAATQVDLPPAASIPEETKDAGPPLMGSVLLRAAEQSLSEAFQVELHYKLAAFDALDGQQPKGDDSRQQQQAEQHGEDASPTHSSPPLVSFALYLKLNLTLDCHTESENGSLAME